MNRRDAVQDLEDAAERLSGALEAYKEVIRVEDQSVRETVRLSFQARIDKAEAEAAKAKQDYEILQEQFRDLAACLREMNNSKAEAEREAKLAAWRENGALGISGARENARNR